MTFKKSRNARQLIAVAMSQVLAISLFSQQAPVGSATDAQWREVLDRRRPPATVAAPKEDASQAQRDKYSQDIRAHFLAVAQAANKFREEHPAHAQAKRAKVIEAENLLKAALSGDGSQQDRRSLLVAEIQADKSLPSRDRFTIVSLAEHVTMRGLVKSRADLRAAQEDSARYLIEEFPDEAGGYLALLAAVNQTEDAAKIAEAAALVRDSGAPFAAKAKAEILAGRYALIGKSLANVANTALGRGNFFEAFRNKRTVLYTWSASVPSSVLRAKEIVGRYSADTAFVGYNLDRDVAAAQAVAKAEQMPGDQYYNEGGPGAWVALLLKLDSPHLVYVTDGGGVIRSVAGSEGSSSVSTK